MKTYSRKNSSYLKKAFVASNFNEMCRLCLSELDLGLTSIFQEFGKISYQEWIEYSVDVLIEEGDGLPPNVCEECLAMVEQTYLFKKKCKASDAKLREHLELLELDNEGKLNDIDMTEDHKNLFKREEPSKSKCDESSAVDTGGTDKEPCKNQTQEKAEEMRREEHEKQQSNKPETQCTHSDTTELSHAEAEEKVVINQVKRYILKGEKRADDQEEDLTQCEVVPLDVKSDESLQSDMDESPTYTTLECPNQNGHASEFSSPQEMKIQEIYQLWDNEEEGEVKGGEEEEDEEGEEEVEEEEEGDKPQDGIMILDVSWEDGSDKSEKKQNVGLLEVDVEQNGVVQLHRVYENKPEGDSEEHNFKCFVCSENFTSGAELKLHLGKFHQDAGDSVFCDKCGKTFVCVNNLKRHMGIHMGYKPHKCKICGRTFSQGSILKRHVFTHETYKPFNCQICGKGYTQKMNLLAHFKNHGFRTETESFNCQHCSKSFVHQSGLSRHLKQHKGVRFPCEHCHKSFGDSSALSRHLKAIHPNKT